jgi:Kef-type K+ transport system membrane component KefB
MVLLFGLSLSQIIPFYINGYSYVSYLIKVVTLIALAFIMIYAGYEFEIKKNQTKEFRRDYLVALVSASLPWIFVTVYFVFFFMPSEVNDWQVWSKTLLTARFASPTSTGILISMLAAAGLSSTWLFRKTKVLAIMDDLDTVILIIPLQILKIGFSFQLLLVVFVMTTLLILVWKFHHVLKLSVKWYYVLLFSVFITLIVEALYFTSRSTDDIATVHIEVLFPAFVLGAMISKKENKVKKKGKLIDITETKEHESLSYVISLIFMFFVGLSMPLFPGLIVEDGLTMKIDSQILKTYLNSAELNILPANSAKSGMGFLFLHALAITIISNLGKMFPLFNYRSEASIRERLALSVAMFPRGEVGAGKLIIALSYGISGVIISVAMLSLVINLILTGVFILVVKVLLKPLHA